MRHKNLYIRPDINGKLPECNQTGDCDDECDHCLKSRINLDKVCQRVNQRFKKGEIKMGAELSSNAGRYETVHITSPVVMCLAIGFCANTYSSRR